MRVGIAGDWHVDLDWALLALHTYADAGITEIFHVGDFSVDNTPQGLAYLEKIEEFLGSHNMNLYVTMGNHDNYSFVRSDWTGMNDEGFQTNSDYPHILVSPRTHRFERGGKSFLSSGGANSINRSSLTPNIDWWEDEQISLGDVYRSVEGGYADVMITHECPDGVALFGKDVGSSWSVEQVNYARKSREAMRQIVDHVKPEILFHGHYHIYLDTVTRFHDGESFYDQRTVGLEMNGRENNMSVLDLGTMEVSFIG